MVAVTQISPGEQADLLVRASEAVFPLPTPFNCFFAESWAGVGESDGRPGRSNDLRPPATGRAGAGIPPRPSPSPGGRSGRRTMSGHHDRWLTVAGSTGLLCGATDLAHVEGAGGVILQQILDILDLAQAGDPGPSASLTRPPGLSRLELADQDRRMGRQDNLLPPLPVASLIASARTASAQGWSEVSGSSNSIERIAVPASRRRAP